MRVDARDSQIFFYPSLPGSSDTDKLGLTCEAVCKSSPVGGGRYTVDDANESAIVGFSASRMVASVCLDADAPSATKQPVGQGADGLFVVATGLPITVLTASAYIRARQAEEDPISADQISALPATAVFFPASPTATTVRIAPLTRFAIVGREDDNGGHPRGPCRELLGNRRMATWHGCDHNDPIDHPCHCSDNPPSSTGCPAGPAVELEGPFSVGVIPDDDPVLQEIDSEVQGDVGQIDGFLGMDLLGRTIVDIDYPGGNLVYQCADATDTSCVVRPRMKDLGAQASIVAAGCNIGPISIIP
jgi:hypothetical protein